MSEKEDLYKVDVTDETRQTIRLSPTPEDGLKRQDAESYIQVLLGHELELGQFRSLLALGTMKGLDMKIQRNAQRVADAIDGAYSILADCIVEWRWLNKRGDVIETEPHDNPLAFDAISMPELNWLLEAISGAIKEDEVPNTR